MRISRLELLRYGRFTDVPIDFPSREQDIHIVFGPNEAGKSTTQSAIEDLLFEIQQKSRFGFLHDYGNMRIGAILQNGDQTLEMRRRKGRKDTLLKPDDTPFPDGERILTSFLAGADRGFFERMFSLDQERLRKGGREILEARDEVGQMLFSAGSGITGLRDKLLSLEEETEALWTSRRAAHRKYYQIQDRLKEAEDAMRSHLVSAKKWEELKSIYESGQQACSDLEQEIEGKSAEQGKLSRIRRVYRDVRKKSELDDAITALGDVVPLPEDARQTLEAAEHETSVATARLDDLDEQLKKAREERDTLTYDETILLREADIQALNERRIKIRDGKTDLPKRRAELAAAESDLQRLAREIEWDDSDVEQLVARIPARGKVSAIRALLTRRGERVSALENAETLIEEAEEKIQDLRQQLDNRGETVDVSRIAAAIEAVKATGDIASRISTAEGELQDLGASVTQRMGLLRPQVVDEQALVTTPIPAIETVQVHRDSLRDLEGRKRACAEGIRAAEQEINRQHREYDRVAGGGDVVSPEDLTNVRERRDAGWSLVRRRHVECVDVSEDEVSDFTGDDFALADAYENAVQEADQTADHRFVNAEAAGRLAGIAEEIAKHEDQVERLRQEEKALADESLDLDAVWQQMWTSASLSPLAPDIMLEWMNARAEILDRIERRDTAERRVAALLDDESKSKEILLTEFTKLGEDTGSLRDDPLRVVIESVSALQRRHEKNAEDMSQMTEALQKAQRKAERKRKALDKAKDEWSKWENQWNDALDGLGLAAATGPESIAAQVDAIDQMREISVRIHELRQERIDKIERDNVAFDADVTKIVKAIAHDLIDVEQEDAVLDLERRFQEAKRVSGLREQKEEGLAGLEKRIEEGEESRRKAREDLDHLVKTAGVESTDDLGDAIARSDTLRKLNADLATVSDVLSKEGDGLTIAALKDECDGIDIDQVAAREQAMAGDLKELRSRLLETRGELKTARENFEAVGGGSVVAQAAAAKQDALAEMQDVAERYVRVRASALMLRWAIDRFRLEKQAPLLRRAGQIFATLTDGSFTDLRVEYDDKDNTFLAGLRQDGSTVRTDGLSTGTADQLYLALRIASVEDYLDRADPLPFIADDLFIHFDDDRAAAGFKVLGELSQKTQVLFFTHHHHLLDIAKGAFDQEASVVQLHQLTPTNAC